MLSEYHDFLEKRRLERKRGHNPVPELPPFVPLPKDELAQLSPASSASFDYESFFLREHTTPSRRSPSVYSRQSSSPAPARSRNIITSPIEIALEDDQRTSPQRPSYLSQLAPFSVTPRKRLFAETSMITVEQESSTQEEEGETHRHKRVSSPSTTRETQLEAYPEQNPTETAAPEDPASIPETEHVHDKEDADMVDVNTHNKIPNEEQLLSPVVEEGDLTEDLSIHELSIHEIHEESHQEDQTHNTPPQAAATSPKANNESDHPPSVLDDPQQPATRDDTQQQIEPQEQAAKESLQQQNDAQQQPAPDDPQQQNEAQQQILEDEIEKSTQAQDETPETVEIQEPAVQENIEISNTNAYRTTIEEETEDVQHETSQSVEAAAAKVTEQPIIQDHAPPETANPEDPVTEGNPIKYGFDDDNIDYGGYNDDDDAMYQEQQEQPADSVSQAGGEQASQAATEEDTSNRVVQNLRTMAIANTLNLKKIRKTSTLHIRTISNLVLDLTKEARDNIADAHEKSIIEDYYYTINDDLKKYHKQYLQYQQCASANRRLKAYHRKKDLQFLEVIKEEGTLKRRIEDLKQEMAELDSKQQTWTRIEDLFHDINQIKDTNTVTKQV